MELGQYALKRHGLYINNTFKLEVYTHIYICYIEMVGFVRAWMSLAIIHLNPLMLRGAKVGHVFGILLHCA